MTTTSSRDEFEQLQRLARDYGVQTSYVDVENQRQEAGPEQLLAVLQVLGAPVSTLDDVPEAARQRKIELSSRWCQPVIVAWDGQAPPVDMWLPERVTSGILNGHLHLEHDEQLFWTWDLTIVPVLERYAIDGTDYVRIQLALPWNLPVGYHQLTFTQANEFATALVIAAPGRAYSKADDRSWGVFLPLYALQTERSWGAGNLGDLEQFLGWVQGLGGEMAGTLPMLAAYLDEPFEPSPYAPVSRLFWNEFYLDVTRVPELEHCRPAREIIESDAFRSELASLRAGRLVDYKRGMALRRSVLAELAGCIASTASDRRMELEKWADNHPRARDYARFRAAVEKQGTVWTEWPERMRQGVLDAGDVDPASERYHLYVQWLMQEQLQTLSDRARAGGTGLYLDFPLGVHGGGYDVWSEQNTFAEGVSVGAPPDPLHDKGQNWGFPPLHPEQLRQDGYRYYIECLRNHLRHAGTLRVDHVMGMHRLYWIPPEMGPLDGVYVSYRPEEFYAILSLESHRNQAEIIGEDLGTVPDEVRDDMKRHNFYRMSVLPFALEWSHGEPVIDVPANSLASLNTHDMPPFAGFWESADSDHRRHLLQALHRADLLDSDTEDTHAAMKSSLDYLAASDAAMVLVNLEDLWLETESQNVPGTVEEHPNWRRKARYQFESFTRMPDVVNALTDIDRLRKQERNEQ